MIVKETGRTPENGQTVVTYHLFVSGLPKELEYTLWSKLPGTNPQPVADGHLNKDGLVVYSPTLLTMSPKILLI